MTIGQANTRDGEYAAHDLPRFANDISTKQTKVAYDITYERLFYDNTHSY